MTLSDFLATAATLSVEERQAFYRQIEERGFDAEDMPVVFDVGSPASSWNPDPEAEKAIGNALNDLKDLSTTL